MNELELLREKYEMACKALNHIADPVAVMQAELKPGYQLDGLAAIRLADDPNFLKGIARDALRSITAHNQ